MGKRNIIGKAIKKKDLFGSGLAEAIQTLTSKNSKFNNFGEMTAKYLKYRENIIVFKDTLTALSKKIKKYESGVVAINRLYVGLFLEYFRYDEQSINKISTEEEEQAFNENYDNIKASQVLRNIVKISSNIKKCGVEGKWDELDQRISEGVIKLDIFNKVIDNIEAPWDISNYYYKSSGNSAAKKNKITSLLMTMLSSGKNIYDLIKVPDIPLDLLFEQIFGAIKQYKHNIRGSDRLFNLIEKKSQLFKDNFLKYYKQTLVSGNPLVIFHEFINDVTKDESIRDTRLIGQCQSLLKELRKGMNYNQKGISKEQQNVSGVIDSVLKFVEEFSDLDMSDNVDPEYVKKMTGEFNEKFLSKITEISNVLGRATDEDDDIDHPDVDNHSDSN
jgi:hypothetical protein